MLKKLYMTYKNEIPNFVIDRWKYLNKDYEVELSLDNECIEFLKTNFNEDVSNLFKNIKKGMYKADLWRLCKLYMEGGTYADVDLVPHVSLDNFNSNTFYSCLALDKKSIFQAFMKIKNKHNPLILLFLVSFLVNKPYTYSNGPTYDMYNCLRYNLKINRITSNKTYFLNDIRLPIYVGNSETNTKIIDLYYFPKIIYNIVVIDNQNYPDLFYFYIENNKLYVTRTDAHSGWGQMLQIEIVIKEALSFYLFEEYSDIKNTHENICVKDNKRTVFTSRDPIYYYNKGWT